MSDYSIDTKLVHAGERREKPIGKPVATPIYSSATYTYDSMAEMDKVFSGEGGDFVYSRYGNPTVAALEKALVTIENGKVAVAYSSGMAAIHAALAACEIVSGSIVLASQDLLKNYLKSAKGVDIKNVGNTTVFDTPFLCRYIFLML